jgi:hypothetical protein
MKDVSCLQGYVDLAKLLDYAMKSLNDEEKLFVLAMNKKVKSYINERVDNFLEFNEELKLGRLWQKYRHLKPFVFSFNPEEKIPEVFQNKPAFIVWTVWQNSHLLGEEDLNKAALVAANILIQSQPPYSPEIKKEAIRGFEIIMERTGHSCSDHGLVHFWTEKIFPYLERKWEFKWELKKY